MRLLNRILLTGGLLACAIIVPLSNSKAQYVTQFERMEYIDGRTAHSGTVYYANIQTGGTVTTVSFSGVTAVILGGWVTNNDTIAHTIVIADAATITTATTTNRLTPILIGAGATLNLTDILREAKIVIRTGLATIRSATTVTATFIYVKRPTG